MNQKPLAYTDNISCKRDIHASDEILLSDIFRGLIRQKKIIAAISIFGILVALVAVLVLPKKYSYFTSVEIAKFETKGKIQPIESLDSINSSIQKNYMPLVLNNYNVEHPGENRQWQVVAENTDKKNDLYTIYGVGYEDGKEFYFSILQSLIDEIKKGEQKRFIVFKHEMGRKIKQLEDELELLRRKRKLFQLQKNILNEESLAIPDEIKKLNIYMADEKNNEHLNIGANKSGYKLFMFFKYLEYMRNARDYINKLNYELNITIPKEKISLAEKTYKNIQEQSDTQNKLNVLKEEYTDFHEMRVIMKPKRSMNPIGIAGKQILLSAFILCFIFSLFVAVIVDRKKFGADR